MRVNSRAVNWVKMWSKEPRQIGLTLPLNSVTAVTESRAQNFRYSAHAGGIAKHRTWQFVRHCMTPTGAPATSATPATGSGETYTRCC